jgi:LemA protein
MVLLLVILIIAVGYFIWAYNSLVKLRNQAKEAWSDIDVQLKRRYNLIPNIVETVKGYATHEEGVLLKVTEARSRAINATNVKDQGAAENMLNSALKSMFAVAESYPQLKANENFLQLQNELVDTEDKIQSARRFHNSVVRDFNTMIEQFPSKLVADMFKFTALEFFELQDDAEREVVKVSFEPSSAKATEAKAPEAPKAPEVPKAPEMPKAPDVPQATLPLESAPKKEPNSGSGV